MKKLLLATAITLSTLVHAGTVTYNQGEIKDIIGDNVVRGYHNTIFEKCQYVGKNCGKWNSVTDRDDLCKALNENNLSEVGSTFYKDGYQGFGDNDEELGVIGVKIKCNKRKKCEIKEYSGASSWLTEFDEFNEFLFFSSITCKQK